MHAFYAGLLCLFDLLNLWLIVLLIANWNFPLNAGFLVSLNNLLDRALSGISLVPSHRQCYPSKSRAVKYLRSVVNMSLVVWSAN